MEVRRGRVKSMKRIEKSDTGNLQRGQRTVELGSQSSSPLLKWKLICCGNHGLSLSSNSFFALEMLSDKEHSNSFQGTIKNSDCIERSLPSSDFPQNCCLGPAPQASFPDQLNSSGADCFNCEWKVITSPLMYKGTLLYWQRESRRRGMSLWNELTNNYHAPHYSLLGV